MRGPPHLIGGGGLMGGALLTFAQAPATSGTWQGHLLCLGQTLPSICPAVRTCSAWALRVGCVSCEFETCGTPAAKTLQGRGFKMWACLCIYVLVCMWKNVCVCVCVVTFLSLSRLPLAWGPPG